MVVGMLRTAQWEGAKQAWKERHGLETPARKAGNNDEGAKATAKHPSRAA